ncbi:MAG TPA: hypothetical protein VJ184_00495 [Chryseolinea sp.]|nr:hypothetical protein [Chryseolinea sp.]
MSCVACKCGVSLSDTGFDCTPVQEVTYKLMAVQTFDSTGTRNKIPFTATLNQAYFDALINNTDKSKRWYPLPAMKAVEDVRGDNRTEEFPDQTMEFIAEGARKFKAWIVGGNAGANSPQMKQLIENIRCGDYSFYIVTVKNQLIGNISTDGLYLEPIEIDEQSISAQFIKKTDTTVQKLQLTFNWSQIASDANLRMIDCDELGDANLQGLRGLLGVCARIINITYTTLKFSLESVFGTPTSPITADGLVVTDFVSSVGGATSKLYNETTTSDVAITGLTESPDGTYELTFAAQILGDVLVIKPLKTGYDFTCVEDAPVDIDS